MIHVDLWGPYKTKTHNGFNHFVTIVDDYTRHVWITLIKYKSDVILVLKNFIHYVETQFSSVIMCLRSDNAREIKEGEMKLFLLGKGIIHQASCPETPQQNGVVERKHRHLLETARALHFQAKLPSNLWGESVLCAAHIINRMPLKSINLSSPYERLYGQKPSLQHLKCYGCLYFASTLYNNRTKFDARARPCVFLGYPPHQKAYKFLDLVTNKIHISRDVVFHEQHFPFHQHTSAAEPVSIPFHDIFLPKKTSHSSGTPNDEPDIFQNFDTSPEHTPPSSVPLQNITTISEPSSSSLSTLPSPASSPAPDLILLKYPTFQLLRLGIYQNP